METINSFLKIKNGRSSFSEEKEAKRLFEFRRL
jgi:hypothetical protein